MLHQLPSIQPRPPSIDVTCHHSSPALMGEYYCIQVGVVNREDGPIINLRVGVALTEPLEESTSLSSQPTGVCACVCVCVCVCD